MKTLREHIDEHYGGSQKSFADAIGWWPANVSNWLKAGYIITAEGWIINPNTTKRDTSHSL